MHDTLVKELRLAGISSLEDANEFLEGYAQRYNQRFAVRPSCDVDMHRPVDVSEKV